jgi:hypothetical protein
VLNLKIFPWSGAGVGGLGEGLPANKRSSLPLGQSSGNRLTLEWVLKVKLTEALGLENFNAAITACSRADSNWSAELGLT